MKITFHSIRAKNFLQIGSQFETFNLNKAPFTVIVGKNGSGKSTLLDMITYALYKKPYRPKVKLGQLINSVNKKQMLVEIAFSIGSSTYIVRRGEKPKVFEIYRDKQLIEPDPSIGDMQNYLEQIILGRSYKTFCQIDIVGKATYKQFLDLEAAQRRAVVEDILDSGIYSIMQGYAKEDLKKLNQEEIELSRDISVIESKISTTTAFLNSMKTDREQEIKEAELRYDQLKDKIIDIEAKLNQKRSEANLAKIEIDKVIPPQHLTKFTDELRKIATEIGGYNSTINRANNIISKIDELETCPHCMQQVDENHKREIVSQNMLDVDTANRELQALKQKQEKFDKIRLQYEAVKDRYAEISREVERISYEVNSERSALSVLSDRINKLRQPPVIDSNLPSLDNLSVELKGKTEERDRCFVKIEKTKQAIKLLGDDGIKAKLIEKYIPKINDTVNDYLEKMGMFVEFNLDSEFNETINAINRENFTYNSFSEGQRIRIDLALLLTWRKIAQIRNSTTTNIFILDEIADGSLDEEGMSDFMAILKSIADTQNTFIISHKDSTVDMFDSVIRAETVGNFSKYSYDF